MALWLRGALAQAVTQGLYAADLFVYLDLVAVDVGDTGRIIAAVLKSRQAVQDGIYCFLVCADVTDDATHIRLFYDICVDVASSLRSWNQRAIQVPEGEALPAIARDNAKNMTSMPTLHRRLAMVTASARSLGMMSANSTSWMPSRTPQAARGEYGEHAGGSGQTGGAHGEHHVAISQRWINSLGDEEQGDAVDKRVHQVERGAADDGLGSCQVLSGQYLMAEQPVSFAYQAVENRGDQDDDTGDRYEHHQQLESIAEHVEPLIEDQ